MKKIIQSDEQLYFNLCGDCRKCCEGMFKYTDVNLYDLKTACKFFPVVFADMNGKIEIKSLLTLHDDAPCYYLQDGNCGLYHLDRSLGCMQFPFLEVPQDDKLFMSYDMRCERITNDNNGIKLTDTSKIYNDFGGVDYFGQYKQWHLNTNKFISYCIDNKLLEKISILKLDKCSLDLSDFLPCFTINKLLLEKVNKKNSVPYEYMDYIVNIVNSLENFCELLKQKKRKENEI